MAIQTIYSNDKEVQKTINSLIKTGKSQLKRTAQDTIAFGKTLISLKNLIKDGVAFQKCIEKEFGLTPVMAHRFMKVAEDSEIEILGRLLSEQPFFIF